MPQSDPSKTEKATPKKREKTREDGDVAKSQEVPKAATTLGGIIIVYAWIGTINERIQEIMRSCYTFDATLDMTMKSAINFINTMAFDLVIILAPIFLFLFFFAGISMRVQVGHLWTMKVFKPKWNKFNPIKGMKNMFLSMQTLVRLIKSIAFAAVIGIAPYLVITDEMDNFILLYNATPEGIAEYMLGLVFKVSLYATLAMIFIALADYFYSRWDYEENIKMSKDEVKDEHKQAEGDPKVRSQQRQKMAEMSQKRMMQDVPTADVIVTNPTHISVALRYNAMEAPAPIVVAMGADNIAMKIREIAKENDIPLRENVPLARALYKSVKVGDQIPEDLYKAVASILASLNKFKQKQ
ncbi:flagellar biosynthesis protein FlhB [Halodesulfovibrio marinisediminis]|uniref:Flagellar biosynthetic protein FlhB n=1 Tax=Halodesulfovibrio marinisediminis DSM 17456 TaxID=1121457 RepID=A0A1N6J1H0_9BACT|nr:flagellar biosynthesis protein FlhB [Halodesulfovibrio marinisediminis]SIO38102.1 flagellar biosynthetic protein FlhB [Halodesulfovibrio marinisediminis DSM 17456]